MNSSVMVETDALQAKLGAPGLVVVDARPAPAFLFGHVPGAVNVAWREFSDPDASTKGVIDPDLDRLARKIGAHGIGNTNEVIVYGDPMEGSGEEARLYWMLRYLGHDDVRVVNGGWFKWKREHRAIERGLAGARPAAAFTPNVRPALLMRKDELLRRLADGALALADARSPEEYHGAASGGRSGGRIPGAKNLPFDAFYNADGTIKPPAAIAAAARAAGITPEHEVVTYCVGGVRSSWLFLLLQTAGYPTLRNYVGSWWEWGGDPTLPIEK